MLALVLHAGCASSPKPKMHVFDLGDKQPSVGVRDATEADYIIRYRPIRLPDYLDRPQIVTRISGNELEADEFNRWGMPLAAAIRHELGSTLLASLPEAFVDFQPWQGQLNTDYLINILIIRLDGVPGDMVDLEVQWTVEKPGEADSDVVM